MYHFGGYSEETYFVRCIGLILGVFQRMNLHDQIPGMHAFRTKHRCSFQPFRFFPLSRVVPHHSADSGSRFSRSYCPIIEYSYQPKILTFKSCVNIWLAACIRCVTEGIVFIATCEFRKSQCWKPHSDFCANKIPPSGCTMPTRCCLLIGDLQLAVPIGYKKERKLREKKLRYRYLGTCRRLYIFLVAQRYFSVAVDH